MATTQRPWQEIATQKQQELLDSIPSEWLISADIKPSDSTLDVSTFPATSGFFTDDELAITASSATDIVKKISTGEWTAETVTLAFSKQAAVAHQLTNCLSETMFGSALSDAKALDAYFAQTGKLKGPLHGLPISLKDNFGIAGKAASVGFVGWAHDLAAEDSSLVVLLKNLGAVAYLKTNVPTAMMIAETVNNLFGRTTNPRNRSLTPGGSSGGEGALLAFGGSPLGVGTDIGGSLRIPGACNGLFILKPSLGRFPHADTKSGMAGQEAVVSVNGPMARTLPDLTLFAKSVIESSPWLIDPKCLPIPWTAVTPPKKLKIGVLRNDGQVMPTPPVLRALESTVEKLRAAGHEIVEWDCEGYSEAEKLLAKFFLADGGKTIKSTLDTSGEPWMPAMTGYSTAEELGVYTLWGLQKERTLLARRYLEKWNACSGLDCILSPTTPYTSVKHDDYYHVGYTCIWNILDYPAVNFPTGLFADEKLDVISEGQNAFGDVDAIVRSKYDAKATHGMPISLQLIGRRLQEEKVLAMAETVVAALK